MTMRLEQEPGGGDDPRQQAFAGVIAGIRRLFKSDAPLPSATTPEKPLEIKRFSSEQREALEKQGFVIYDLTGQSIKTLRASGHKFRSTWHQVAQFADFEALGSMQGEVAINPLKPFLPASNNKTLAQQEEMVAKFSQELGKEVKGVKAIIGQAPDYIELAFAYLDATGEYLFGTKDYFDYYDYARTKTPTSDSDVACVGDHNVCGLRIYRCHADAGNHCLFEAPLVVPA